MKRIGRLTLGGAAALAVVGTTLALGAAWTSGGPSGNDKPVKTEKRVVVVRAGDEGSGAFLGVGIREDDDQDGARVTWVAPDSPAAEAGIEAGDVIVSFDGETIRGPVTLTERIRKAEPGATVAIGITRDGTAKKLEVELGERPKRMVWTFGSDEDGPIALEDFDFNFDPGELIWKDEAFKEHLDELRERIESGEIPGQFRFDLRFGRPLLGVELVPATADLREHLGAPRDAGILVGKVLDDSAAKRAGVRVGDVIVAVDGERIEDSGDLIRALGERAGESVDLEIVRDRATIHLDVSLPERDEDGGPAGVRALLCAPEGDCPGTVLIAPRCGAGASVIDIAVPAPEAPEAPRAPRPPAAAPAAPAHGGFV